MSEGGDFIAANGPIQVTREAGRIVLGLRLERRHCTPGHVAHTATLIGLVEAAMDRTIAELHGRKATIASITGDMVGTARLGDRIEAHCETTRMAQDVIFMRGEVRANGEPALTASALWKRGA